MAFFRSISMTLEMIKWEHSVLTLPFGLTGAVLAARGIPNLHTSIWIIVALVAARSAAMAFNRLADATIDAANPRTRIRALPAGQRILPDAPASRPGPPPTLPESGLLGNVRLLSVTPLK